MVILPPKLLSADGIELPGATETPQRGALRILLLNLMPEKAVTERDFIRLFSAMEEWVELIPMKIAGQVYKTTPAEHMEMFYRDFDTLCNETFDGLIVTGAPVEHLAFEEVRYWEQLCTIIDWAHTHVASTLYICWAAQAALYHRFGIRKYELARKQFGIFPHRQLKETPILRGLGTTFPVPISRHTTVSSADFPVAEGLTIVADSDIAGVGIVEARGGRDLFITGHLEYAAARLDDEYKRDLLKGARIDPPENYYRNGEPYFVWEETAQRFYRNYVDVIKSFIN